jgi:FlaG/FlaF family flagellin (archaellin)
MKAKTIIAAVALVAIVVIGAAVLYTQYFNKLDVDVPKERGELAVKDYYLGTVDGTVTSEESEPNTPGASFLVNLYRYDGVKGETANIKYKGTTIVCDIWSRNISGTEYYYYKEPTSGVTYSYKIVTGGQTVVYTLKDSNLDLSKIEAEQVVINGSYYKYDYSAPVYDLGVDIKGEYEYKMTNYNTGSGMGTMKVSLNGTMNGDVKYTIKEFNSAGRVVIKEDSRIMTRDDYLSSVNYTSFIRYAEDEGYKVTYGDKSSDTIDTEFGKRKVTIEKIKLTRDSEVKNFILTYGEKGFIYKEELSTTYDGKEMNATFVLKETNLIVK